MQLMTFLQVSTSKTGKHGHAKANITGLDIFTNKKYEEICPTSHNMVAPVVTRSEWILTDIGEEMGFAALMDESGEMREDLRVPDDEEYAQLRTSWNEAMDAGKDFYVTVVGAPVINGGKEEPMERIMPNGFQAKQA